MLITNQDQIRLYREMRVEKEKLEYQERRECEKQIYIGHKEVINVLPDSILKNTVNGQFIAWCISCMQKIKGEEYYEANLERHQKKGKYHLKCAVDLGYLNDHRIWNGGL